MEHKIIGMASPPRHGRQKLFQYAMRLLLAATVMLGGVSCSRAHDDDQSKEGRPLQTAFNMNGEVITIADLESNVDIDEGFYKYLQGRHPLWRNLKKDEFIERVLSDASRTYLRAEYHFYMEEKFRKLPYVPKDKYIVSRALKEFPYTCANDRDGGWRDHTVKIIHAAEKYLNDDTLSEVEKYIIDNLEAEWNFHGNTIDIMTYEIMDKLLTKGITREEVTYYRELYYGANNGSPRLGLEAIRQEVSELIPNALRKQKAEAIYFESLKSKVPTRIALIMAVIFFPLLFYSIKRYRTDKKMFTTEEKEVIANFKDVRKKILTDPSLIIALGEAEKEALYDVDDPNKGNISEIQRKLKITMSKYNEFHLCAIERIKRGKYYELRKRHDPKKYGGEGKVLQKVLADHYQIKSNRLFVFDNGSSEGLAEILKVYGKDKRILLEVPTYGPIYETARTVSKTSGQALSMLQNDLAARDLDALAVRLEQERPGLAVLCNPSNPGGQFTPAQELYELCGRFPDTVFLIDEAYMDFQEAYVGKVTSYEQLPHNVIVLRTFSKMHGLAGLRLGYAISSRKHIDRIKTFPFMRFVIADAEYSAAHSIDQFNDYTKKFVRPVIEDNLKIIEKYKGSFGEANVFNSPAPNMVLICLDGMVAPEHAQYLDLLLRADSRIYINLFGKGASFDSNKIGFDDKVYIRISLLDKKTNEKIFKELIEKIELLKKVVGAAGALQGPADELR